MEAVAAGAGAGAAWPAAGADDVTGLSATVVGVGAGGLAATGGEAAATDAGDALLGDPFAAAAPAGGLLGVAGGSTGGPAGRGPTST